MSQRSTGFISEGVLNIHVTVLSLFKLHAHLPDSTRAGKNLPAGPTAHGPYLVIQSREKTSAVLYPNLFPPSSSLRSPPLSLSLSLALLQLPFIFVLSPPPGSQVCFITVKPLTASLPSCVTLFPSYLFVPLCPVPVKGFLFRFVSSLKRVKTF